MRSVYTDLLGHLEKIRNFEEELADLTIHTDRMGTRDTRIRERIKEAERSLDTIFSLIVKRSLQSAIDRGHIVVTDT